MRPVELLGLLALQLAVPVVAISGKSCERFVSPHRLLVTPRDLARNLKTDLEKRCSQSFDEADYLHVKTRFSAGGDPPPPPNPRPHPPPRLPRPQTPPPGTQLASDDLWDKSGAKGCTLGWGSAFTYQDLIRINADA
jgi:hypothetical protein